MRNCINTLCLISLFIFSTNTMAVPIGLEGDEIDAAMIRTILHPYYGIGRICCYGLDSPFVVENGLGDQVQYSSSFMLDVNSLDFNLNYIGLGGWQDGIILRLSDLDFANNSKYLVDLDIDTNVAGLSWFVGDDFINLHLGGTRQDQGLYISGAFVLANVAEPSSLSLLLFALAFMFFTHRKYSGAE